MMAIKPPLLVTIFTDADKIAPSRSRLSDGWIGDPAHQARNSDHNPDARGIVHAADLTHDPAGGFDSYWWARCLAGRCKNGAERRIKYVVSFDPVANHDVIASPIDNWAWRAKTTKDHANHVHISILSGDAVEQSTAPVLIRENPPPDPRPKATQTMLIPHPTDPGPEHAPRVVRLDLEHNQILGYNGARLRAMKSQAFGVWFHILPKPAVGWFPGALAGRVRVLYSDGTGETFLWA